MALKDWVMEKTKKKKSTSDDLLELIGMDEEEMSRDDCTVERKKELRMQMSQKYDCISRLESSKTEGKAKIWAAIIAGVAAVGAVVAPIVNYNVQYRRSLNPDDETQMQMGRSKFSPSNQCKKP